MATRLFEEFLELGFVECRVVGMESAGCRAARFNDGFVEERGWCVDIHDVMANLERRH